MPPISKKLKGQIGLGLFICPSIFPSPHPPKIFFSRFGFFVKKITYSDTPLPPPSPPSTHTRAKKSVFFIWILCKTNSLTLANPPLPSPPQIENKFCFQTWILLKNITYSSNIPPPPTRQNFFGRFGFFIKKSLSGFFVKENFTYPSRHPPSPPPPHRKNNSFMHQTLDTCSVWHCQ